MLKMNIWNWVNICNMFFGKLNLSVSGNNNYSSSTNKNHCISCLTEQDRALTSVRMGAKMTSQKIYYVCLYIKIKYWLIIFCLTCSKDISDQIHYNSFDIVLLNLFKNPLLLKFQKQNHVTKKLSIQSICVFPFPGNIFLYTR